MSAFLYSPAIQPYCVASRFRTLTKEYLISKYIYSQNYENLYKYGESRNMRVSLFQWEGRKDSKILRVKSDILVIEYSNILENLNLRCIVRYKKWKSMSFDGYGDTGDSRIYNSLRVKIYTSKINKV